ncbi:MAG: NUDIX hydrolase [Rhodobacteraceae bacterium]|nr:NUDIX hydrolase [Paracoccaceae bacterium]MCW9044096.1 NUDIX hydrolase [Pseudopelagicola sp.]
MTDTFKNALNSVVSPLIRRPRLLQVAALCYREDGPKKKVLLITSRNTQRWIVPKGWHIDGLDAPGAALQEAWEEAGVKKAAINPDSIGSFDYSKRLENGVPVPVEAQVFAVEVESLKDDFPESEERTRKWVAPEEAAEMVEEPGLRSILRQM